MGDPDDKLILEVLLRQAEAASHAAEAIKLLLTQRVLYMENDAALQPGRPMRGAQGCCEMPCQDDALQAWFHGLGSYRG